LLVFGFDLLDNTEDPATRQFLASLYHYVGSAAFQPSQELGTDLLGILFKPKLTKLQALCAKVSADSQASEEYGADQAIDGDPDTIWHTPWDESAPKFPHELVLALAKPATLAGITCLPRQDGNENGWIKDYVVFASADGTNWGAPVAKGAVNYGAELQTVKFANPIETRYLIFVAKSSFDSSKPYASLAELDVILEE
jgi:hypothetical protein